MIERHVVFYVSSKVLAAILNLAAVAVFTRLAGPAGYGDYLIAFAWAYVVYGWTAQWLPLSFFAHYEPDGNPHLVPTLYQLVAATLVGITLIAVAATLTGAIDGQLATKVVVLVWALAIYDTAMLVGRTMLRAGRVSFSIVLRGLLVLVMGILSLLMFHSAFGLAIAVAAANVLAVAPLLPLLRMEAHLGGSRATALRYLGYGWPLMASFGASSLGQNIDRLLLAKQHDSALVGPYGAVGDLIRQSLVFISEAIAIAYMPLAKSAAAADDMVAARGYLTQAFRALSAVFFFGAVVLLTFAEKIIALVLGPVFATASAPLIPWFALAAGLTIFRSYYLGQVIYFTGSSRLELVASLATVGVTAVLALILIPLNGTVGAAIAMAAGQAAACAVFLGGAMLDHNSPLPLPWLDFLVLGVWALGGFAAARLIGHLLPNSDGCEILQAIVIGISMVGAVRVYNIMNVNDILGDLAKLTGKTGMIGDT